MVDPLNMYFDISSLDSVKAYDLVGEWSRPCGGTSLDSIRTARRDTLTDALPLAKLQPKILIENGLAKIPEEHLGKSFALFDLNGKVLRQGILQSILQLPKQPCILKISGEKEIFVK